MTFAAVVDIYFAVSCVCVWTREARCLTRVSMGPSTDSGGALNIAV